jgi:hypothetical protein
LNRPGTGFQTAWTWPEGGVAVLDRVDQDAHPDQVEDVGELLAPHHHLLVDGVVVLGPAAHRGPQLHLLELGVHLLDDLGDVLLAGRLALGRHARDLLVPQRVQGREGQVLQLPLDLVDAEPVGQRGVDLQDLAGLALLVLAVQVADVAHVVEPVGQLDDQHPDVAGHGDDHLADDLGLGRLPALEADAVQLAEPVGDLGHLGPELLADLLQRQQALLERVVQQGGLDRHGVQAQVGHDRGHPQGVGQVRDARGPAAAGVALAGQLEGAPDGGGVGPRVALADPLEQRLHGRLGRQPGVVGPGDGLGGGPFSPATPAPGWGSRSSASPSGTAVGCCCAIVLGPTQVGRPPPPGRSGATCGD